MDDRFDPDNSAYKRLSPGEKAEYRRKKQREEDEHMTYVNLHQWLWKRFDEGKAGSDEVKRMVQIFGREKIKRIYLRWKEQKKNEAF